MFGDFSLTIHSIVSRNQIQWAMCKALFQNPINIPTQHNKKERYTLLGDMMFCLSFHCSAQFASHWDRDLDQLL